MPSQFERDIEDGNFYARKLQIALKLIGHLTTAMKSRENPNHYVDSIGYTRRELNRLLDGIQLDLPSDVATIYHL